MARISREMFDLIRGKRDGKALETRPVPDEVMRRILQAGRMAGSAKNGQPNRFIALRERANKERLAACGTYTQRLPDSPLVVAIAQKVSNSDLGELFDAGRAAQNMMLAAWAEGITSCPNTLQRYDEAARVLGLPEGYRIPVAILFGYPEDTAEVVSRPRLSYDEYVHMERWSGEA